MVQNPASHCRDLTGRTMPADAMLPHPVHLSPVLASCCLRGLHRGTAATGRPASSQRRLEGFQMMGRPIGSGPRLGGVGMLWRGRWLWGPFGASRMPVRPWMLASPFDALGERLLWAASFAGAPGCPPQRTHALPLPPLPIGQERQIARVLADRTHETHGFLQALAVLPSPGQLPQKAGRSSQQDARPALRRIWSPRLVDACRQLIPCKHLQEKRLGHSQQPQSFLKPLRRSGQRERRGFLTPYRRVAAWRPPPSGSAARTGPTRAMGVFNWARGGGRVAAKVRAQGAPWDRGRGAPHGLGEVRWASTFFPCQEGHRMWGHVIILSSRRQGYGSAEEPDATPPRRPTKLLVSV